MLALMAGSGSGALAQDQTGQTTEQLPASASGWQYTANTNAAFTLTDNVLATQLNPKSDFITTVTAGAQVLTETRGGSINFNYQLSFDYYINTSELNGMRHNLLSQNTFVVTDGLFYVDVNASVREQATNRNLRTPASTRTINNNRTMVLTGSVSPYIDTTIANRVGVIVRADFSTVKFRKPDVSGSSGSGDDDNTWAGSFAVSELDRDRRFHWEISARASADDDDLEKLGGDLALRLKVGQSGGLIARGGYDKTDGRLGGKDIDNAMWRVGFEIEPVRDSYIRAEAGERFGGPSYDAEVRYDIAKALKVTASYSQELRTDQNQFVDFLNDYEPFVPGGTFVGVITEDPFSPYFGFELEGDIVNASALTDTGRVTLSGGVGKIQYSLTGGYVLREFEENLGVNGPFEEETVSVTASLSRPFGRRTEIGIGVNYLDEESDLPTLGEDNQTIVFGREIDSLVFGGSASYALSPTAIMQINYIRSERENEIGIRVEENAAVLTVTKTW